MCVLVSVEARRGVGINVAPCYSHDPADIFWMRRAYWALLVGRLVYSENKYGYGVLGGWQIWFFFGQARWFVYRRAVVVE